MLNVKTRPRSSPNVCIHKRFRGTKLAAAVQRWPGANFTAGRRIAREGGRAPKLGISVLDAELGINVLEMFTHGRGTNSQNITDLAVRFSAR